MFNPSVNYDVIIDVSFVSMEKRVLVALLIVGCQTHLLYLTTKET